MAEIEIILQGLSPNDNHEKAINKLLIMPDMDSYLFSLAFVRKNGVIRVRDNLKKVASKSQIFIGIRNGITSVQSIFSFLEVGINPYAVDTASSKKIFHPKIYAAYSDHKAYIILGSANLTFSGLNKNIEASSYIKLDRSQQLDEEFVQKLVTTITELPEKHPDHIFQITTPRQAVRLMHEGRLEDERIARLPANNAMRGSKPRDQLAPMLTYEKRKPKPNQAAKKREVKTGTHAGILVWESKPLTERSLNIPTGKNTHPTGDINLGKGGTDNMDFQNYFRENVFSGLLWSTSPDSAYPYLERGTIAAELIVKGLHYGEYELEVTHNPKADTVTSKQRNVKTKIKWGNAKPIIAKQDLLGRTLQIYKKNATDFIILID